MMSKSTRYRQRVKAARLASLMLTNDPQDDSSDDSSIIHQIYPKRQLFENVDNDSVQINDVNEINNANYTSKESSITMSSDSYSSESDAIEIPQFEDLPNAKIELAKWALRHKITHVALGDLLSILQTNPDLSDIPKDPRTLLKTPSTTSIKKIGGGTYHHFGLKKEIELMLETIQSIPSKLCLVVGIDGLAITNNPTTHLWPILGYFSNLSLKRKEVFIIGAYIGLGKPTNSNEFLEEFVNELKCLINMGISFNDMIITIELSALICDAPAKSFVLNVRGHNFLKGCVRCTTTGRRVNNRICFVNINAPLRSHSNFINHDAKNNFHVGPTLLIDIPNFDIVLSTPFDYMHLVCIGVTKKLISFWVSSGSHKHNLALPYGLIEALEIKLNRLTKFIPDNFQRRPNENSRVHPLRDIKRWKANELRQCLLYTGMVIFQNIVSKDMYSNFITLTVAIRILLTPNASTEYIDYANSLLESFIMSFINLYGEQYVSHNIHALVHLSDDTKRFGSLDNISAFPFENFMQPIKKDIRSGHKPLQQLMRRYGERRAFKFKSQIETCQQHGPIKAHCKVKNRPLLPEISYPQYTGWQLLNFKIKINDADCCVKVKSGQMVSIENIATLTKTGEIVIIGRAYNSLKDLFLSPCKSTLLNIYEASELGQLQFWPIKEVLEKLVRLPTGSNLDEHQQSSVIMPFLHST